MECHILIPAVRWIGILPGVKHDTVITAFNCRVPNLLPSCLFVETEFFPDDVCSLAFMVANLNRIFDIQFGMMRHRVWTLRVCVRPCPIPAEVDSLSEISIITTSGMLRDA